MALDQSDEFLGLLLLYLEQPTSILFQLPSFCLGMSNGIADALSKFTPHSQSKAIIKNFLTHWNLRRCKVSLIQSASHSGISLRSAQVIV